MGILGQSVMGQYIFSIKNKKKVFFFCEYCTFHWKCERRITVWVVASWWADEIQLWAKKLLKATRWRIIYQAFDHHVSSLLLPVLYQPLSVVHSLPLDISLASWSPQPQRLLGRGGDPLGLQRPRLPTGGAHGSPGKGRAEILCSLRSFLVAMLKLNKWLVYPWGPMQSVHLRCAE